MESSLLKLSFPSLPSLTISRRRTRNLTTQLSLSSHLTAQHSLSSHLILPSFSSSSSSNSFPTFPTPNPTTLTSPQTPTPIIHRRFLAFSSSSSSAAHSNPILPTTTTPKFLGIELPTLKKVIPLGLMFFCILFNYTILRDTKDVLVITAKGSSAEIIPFLKTWVNLPMAIGFMLVYTKLSNVLSKEALFYSCMFPFIAFFGAFAFLLYPNSSLIHPTGLADRLLKILGTNFLGPIAILRIWSFCLFYVMAELWGSVVVSLLFWGFANQV